MRSMAAPTVSALWDNRRMTIRSKSWYLVLVLAVAAAAGASLKWLQSAHRAPAPELSTGTLLEPRRPLPDE